MTYGCFMMMIATSTIVMYGLMFLNTYSIDHVFFSETRFWMAFVMGAVMVVIMLAFMWSMSKADDAQLEQIAEMAEFISPRPGATQHPLTIHAATQMNQMVERAKHFRT